MEIWKAHIDKIADRGNISQEKISNLYNKTLNKRYNFKISQSQKFLNPKKFNSSKLASALKNCFYILREGGGHREFRPDIMINRISVGIDE